MSWNNREVAGLAHTRAAPATSFFLGPIRLMPHRHGVAGLRNADCDDEANRAALRTFRSFQTEVRSKQPTVAGRP